MEERIVILGDTLTQEEFRAGATHAGWKPAGEHPPSRTNTYEQIYVAGPEHESTVHYIEDQFVKVHYAYTRGPHAAALAEGIAELFPHAPDDLILTNAEDDSFDSQTQVHLMMRATVLGDQAGHARLCAIIEKRLRDEHPGVRRAALTATRWLEWADFRATVEQMAKDDPADEVREDAASLAQSYAMRDAGKS